MKQSPSFGIGEHGETDRSHRKDDAHKGYIDGKHGEIARPARRPADPQLSPRRTRFPARQERKDAGKRDQPDCRLMR